MHRAHNNKMPSADLKAFIFKYSEDFLSLHPSHWLLHKYSEKKCLNKTGQHEISYTGVSPGKSCEIMCHNRRKSEIFTSYFSTVFWRKQGKIPTGKTQKCPDKIDLYVLYLAELSIPCLYLRNDANEIFLSSASG